MTMPAAGRLDNALNDIQEKKLNKLQLLLSDSEFEALETWRFENRATSRAAAIRMLIRLGMEATQEGGPPPFGGEEDDGVSADA